MLKIKCIVWDLDNTLWKGVLSEGDHVELKKEAIQVIKELDHRGILNSVASKNDYDLAWSKLKELQISEYFLYPKISWNAKSQSIREIAKDLNLDIRNFAFIDDEPYELEEVKFGKPDVLCLNASNLKDILDMPEFQPEIITKDTSLRRKMYQDDLKRKNEEVLFGENQEKFLKQLNMKFTIKRATMDDLERVSELCARTHQLNTTGYTYSYEELTEFVHNPLYRIYITELEDKYGSYGKIGIALILCEKEVWYLKLLLMSCRVMSRNVGGVLLNYITQSASKNNVKLIAEFKPTDRNRMMYVTYKFHGFEEVEKTDGDIVLLENKVQVPTQQPDYLDLLIDEN